MNPFDIGRDLKSSLSQQAPDPFKTGEGLKSALNQQNVDTAQGIFALPAEVPQFKKGKDAAPKSLKAYAKGRDKIAMNQGEIQGPGTPTSDSIPAMVSDEEAILNAGAVQALKSMFGDDVIKMLNEQYSPEGAESGMMGGAMHAAGGADPMTLKDARQASQGFFQEPFRQPAPIPGRGNPANPAELMQSRLATSANAAPAQAASLREHMMANKANAPTVGGELPPKPAFAPKTPFPAEPPPNPGGLKGAMQNANGAMGLSVSLADMFLREPRIAQGRDDAIAGLKAKAGIAPEKTPYSGLNAMVNPDRVPKFAVGKDGSTPTDTYPADPNRFGYQGVPSTKQLSTQVRTGNNLVPTGEGAVPPIKEPFVSQRAEAPYKPNFTVEPGTNPQGTMQANRALTPYTNDPWTGEAPSKFQLPKFDVEGLKGGVKSLGTGLKSIATDPSFFIPAADAANQALLERGLASGNAGIEEAARVPLSLASRAPGLVAEKLAGPIGEGPASRLFGRAVEALTPTPEIVPFSKDVMARQLADRWQNPPANGDSGGQRQAAQQTVNPVDVSDPNIYGPGGKNYGPNPSAQQLRELFPAQPSPQDQALAQYKQYLNAQFEAQKQADDYARTQNAIHLANYGQVVPGAERLGYESAFRPQELQAGQENARIAGLSEAAKLAQQAQIEQAKLQQNKYNARTNPEGGVDVYAESGPAADESYQASQQQQRRRQNALAIMADDNATDQQKSVAQVYLKSLGMNI